MTTVRLGLPVLYLRSRALPATLAALAATAVLAAWAADRLQDRPEFDHTARVPVLALAPLLAAAAIGTGLLSHTEELDRTAVRRWWPRRLTYLLALTALAAGALALAVPGHPEHFGAPAMVRNVVGATGVTAAAAALLGARASWLPMTVYGGAVYLAAPRTPGGAAAYWAWPMQPGPEVAAWVTAGTAYVVGAALLALRGPRPDHDHAKGWPS
ncbi:hypothetical protein ABZ702_23190 [Streptomyces cyaneofuscatus]|uniref:hypothetical protein n=1 Tax=Streptomyces cyaneofuscatus TaxID=66883 RepID=UPI00340E01A7